MQLDAAFLVCVAEREQHLIYFRFVLRSRDFYHTCYCLSGLSVAQNFNEMDKINVNVVGNEDNLLVRKHFTFHS